MNDCNKCAENCADFDFFTIPGKVAHVVTKQKQAAQTTAAFLRVNRLITDGCAKLYDDSLFGLPDSVFGRVLTVVGINRTLGLITAQESDGTTYHIPVPYIDRFLYTSEGEQ